MPNDLRSAFLSLRRAPGFCILTIAALAICIGANTAIFTVVNTVLFRPLSFPRPEQLVDVEEALPNLGYSHMPFSCPDYLFVSSRERSLQATATYTTGSYEISGIDRPQSVIGARVTQSLFNVLKVWPVVGRSFTPAEDREDKRVVVVTYGFAQRTFGGTKQAIGKMLVINRAPYTIIGVMPRRFTFPPRGLRFNSEPADIFVPVSWTREEREGYGLRFNHSMIARLRSGVTVGQAQSELQTLLSEFFRQYPAGLQIPGLSLEGHVSLFSEEITGNVRQPLIILLCAVGLVLLIGCADIANLMLSRTVARQREFAIKSALGASRWRLARQTFAEGLILSAIGGCLGLLLAFWSVPLLLRLGPEKLPRFEEISVDWRVLCFVAALTLATPLLFCLAPVFDLAKAAVMYRLREGGRTGTQSKQQRALMSGMVVTQFALAFVLLVAASLLIRSLIRAMESDPGFRPDRVVSVRVALPVTAYSNAEEALGFYETLIERLRNLPGVQQAAAISDLPMSYTSGSAFVAEGGSTSGQHTDILETAGNALQLLGVKLLQGRFLNENDAQNSPLVTVISQSFAQHAWPGEDPIGRRVRFGVSTSHTPWMTVVGVFQDVKSSLVSNSPRVMMFVPDAQKIQREMSILVKTSLPPAAIASSVRREVHRLDPSLPVQHVQTLDSWLAGSLAPERFRTFLLSAFAGAALLLAILGIGGLLAYNTVRRTQELGVRMALGAQPKDLLRLVLRQGLRLSLAGAAIGLLASFAVTRALSGLLYGVGEYDLEPFINVPILLALIGLAASLWPAWRAMRVDPLQALRME